MNNNELKKKVTDVVLNYLEVQNPIYDFYVSGGAPRDWFFGREVNDIDIYSSSVAYVNTQILITHLNNVGLKCAAITSGNKTSSGSSYGSTQSTTNPNKHITNIVQLDVLVNSRFVSIDLITLDNLSEGFRSIWNTYDIDICMIGYKDGRLWLSEIFDERYSQKQLPSKAFLNPNININLLNYCQQHHFPKIQKKYPELKTAEIYVGWDSLDTSIYSNIPFPDFNREINNAPIVVGKPVACLNHQWTATQLIFSTVYDCKHCGMKKEDWENHSKQQSFERDFKI